MLFFSFFVASAMTVGGDVLLDATIIDV